MNERDALLAAIRATPEDDTLRLVFADWLDENDQPHWAALIRAECERERLREDGSAAEALIRFFDHIEAQGGGGHIAERVRWNRADPDTGERLAREKAVSKLRPRSTRVRNARRPAPAKCGLDWSAGTHRGFQASATVIYGDRFAKRFDEVVRWGPPVELTFGYSANVPGDLVDRGLLAWVRGLDLRDEHSGLFQAMSAHPDATGVRALTYRAGGGDLDTYATAVAAFAAALTGSPHWTGLRSLDIPEDDITRAAPVLFAGAHMRGLTSLRLYSANWTLETMDALLRAPLHNVRELMLRFGSLDDAAAERLAASPMLGNLQYLDLSGNSITARGATALLTSKHLKSLTILELERNPIQNLDRAALAAAPKGGLRAISLHNCSLEPEDVAAFAQCPRFAELLYLDLDYNGLNNTAIKQLVAGLPCAPAIVYLMGNGITANGAKSLAMWAGKPGLDQLHVCRNPLTGEGAAALAASRRLAGLRHLCATVDVADQAVLAARFKKRVEFPA